MSKRAQQIVILKTYGGVEGVRVKRGTIFTIGENMDLARYKQLEEVGLAAEYDEKLHSFIARGDTPRRPLAKIEPDSSPPDRTQTRRAVRNKAKQTDNPPEPEQLNSLEAGQSLNGGSTGLAARPLSSPEAPALGAAILKPRGQRNGQVARSTSSPSTPVLNSSLMQTPSTPVTPPGGENTTTTSENSEAFE